MPAQTIKLENVRKNLKIGTSPTIKILTSRTISLINEAKQRKLL